MVPFQEIKLERPILQALGGLQCHLSVPWLRMILGPFWGRGWALLTAGYRKGGPLQSQALSGEGRRCLGMVAPAWGRWQGDERGLWGITCSGASGRSPGFEGLQEKSTEECKRQICLGYLDDLLGPDSSEAKSHSWGRSAPWPYLASAREAPGLQTAGWGLCRLFVSSSPLTAPDSSPVTQFHTL